MEIILKTRELCRKFDIKPSRSKGQNFLIDSGVYDRIIEAADLNKDDTVLEVGPGLGFLTERLARKVKKVIAVELDDKLVKILKVRLKEQGIENAEVVNKDVLEFGIRNSEFGISKYSNKDNPLYKIVANLPYNITSRFLRKYLSSGTELNSGYPELSSVPRLSAMVLMLQKEVAERITAMPGKMSLLAVSVQYYSEPKIIDYVPKSAFWPEPEVNSAILRLNTKRTNRQDVNEKDFFRLVRIGFSSRRKMLKNNLAGGYRISTEEAGKRINSAGFSEKVRAQELSVNDWIKLFENFK